MIALRRTTNLVCLLAAEAGAVALLWRLGDVAGLAVPLDDLSVWLTVTPPDLAIVAVLRLLGLAGATWLLASTLLYTLASASRIPSAVRAVEWTTLPAVRRVADRALAVTLATSVMAGPTAAFAATSPPPPLQEPAPPQGLSPAEASVLPPEVAPAEAAPLPPALRPPEHVPVTEPEAPVPTTTGAATSVALPAVHVVAPGESLWSIAAAVVNTRDPHRVAPYWLRLLAANHPVPSGDPDLLRPGERVSLPPLSG